MAQTGCPHGTGTGGSKLPEPEAGVQRRAARARHLLHGARRKAPNSANSQFFICFDDAGFLNKQYTVWGEVMSGMENVDKIKRGEPVRDPDRIVTARVG